MQKNIGLYIHIPFCKSKCYYCDFTSFAGKEKLYKSYVEAIIKEMEHTELSKYNIKTVYIGGGTPSILDSKDIGRIIEKIKINTQKEAEITIEVNPGTNAKEKMKDYIGFGINRISIGLQSTDNNLLKQIGRIHSYEEFLDTYKMARKVGFRNINVDLILGIPNQTLDGIKDSLKKVIRLKANHISIYSLIVEEGTKLEKMIRSNELEMIDETLERKMYWETKRMLEEEGYIHYEISNFAQKGYEAKHNLDCWSQKEYLGIGIAAHSYMNGTRFSNIEDIERYIDNINNGKFENNIIVHEKQQIEDMRKRIYVAWVKKIARN